MAMWYWPYTLTPKRRLSAIAADAPRRGALVRIEDGFADVHPWPELGDEPLEAQLQSLRRGEPTQLIRRTLALASADGEARRDGRSLFDGLTIPQSHWPTAAGDVPAAFDTVKVKMAPGGTVDPQLSRYRLRLDFNATLDEATFVSFVDRLPDEVRSAIDFMEDPCPYDGAVWSRLRQRCRVPLALDRGEATDGVDVLVCKPAVQDVASTVAHGKRVVVTSYMDHPVGQLGAAFFAAVNGTAETCGLITHVLYEADPFIERMRLSGTRLVPAAGTGLGFDDLLDSLPWKRLA